MPKARVVGRPDHVCVAAQSIGSARDFYEGILGFRQNKTKPWIFRANSSFAVHACALEPLAQELPDVVGWGFDTRTLDVQSRSLAQLVNHFALTVDSIEAVATQLLDAGMRPFQMDEDGNRRDVDEPANLSYGLGSVFVHDPAGNLLEFGERGRGIWRNM
jgi:catechol 2,3-dioxygenase-like lactoylglutathione lyase family enzyme